MSDWDEWETTSIAMEPGQYDVPQGRNSAWLIVIAGTNIGTMHKIDKEVSVLGRGSDADIRLPDNGVSRHHCQIVEQNGRLCVEDLKSRNGTFCNGERTSRRELQDGDKLQLGQTTILKFSYHDQLDENFQQKMLDSALRDGLTGSYNKRYFMERLDSEIRFALRHRVDLALMMLDLDHFKAVNDTHGHLAGDTVLNAVSHSLQTSIRNEDVLARYGGEEFALIVRAIAREDVLRFANRLCRQVADLKPTWNNTVIPITVSIGIATVPHSRANTTLELIQAADEMLYEAKHAGRNQVIMAPVQGE